ncbi:MAG TPA: DegQ family serine endoprotease [Caldithrix abyssi]|uniref:DegQ family serine endoprotease n=1 Tax=Caldithrix abyssi TaxID=187145 RepID=A0A7V5PP89_CALAY|nr:DegQ family serine endoprotease [Caldithrix abyssi]
MNKLKNSFAMVLGLVTIGVVIGVVLTTNFNLDSKSVAKPLGEKVYTEASSDTGQNVTIGTFDPNSMFTKMVEKVRPTIVSIYTEKNVKVQMDPFFYFFRDFGQMPNDQFHQPEMKQRGLGSGIIISSDGYILTNNHVVEDVDDIRVKLIDGREFKAKLVGNDPSTEIGLIKIKAKDLPVAILGDSDKLRIGEWVMAIGNPLELTSTVTAGIVSALHRDINIIRGKNSVSSIENFIQTDAAINPGNSGGALVNLKGEVIGVNTAIATRTNYYMGYGFAVPINIAKKVVQDLKEYGEVRRGYLGVYIAPVDPVTAKGVKLSKPRGVLVTSVIKGSAADKAGIKEGDVIFSVDGKEVNQPNELQAKIGTHNPGDKVKLVIWRDGKTMTFTVKLEERSGEIKTKSGKEKKGEKKSLPDLGMKIRDLSEREMDELELTGGALIIGVEEESAAYQARLSRGDVIIKLNDQPVKSVSDFYDQISKFKKGDVVRLKVRRKQGDEIFDRLAFLEIPSDND